MASKTSDNSAEHGLVRRKAPQQRRSEMMVQSILQATLELAKSEGFLKLGTTRIAERAGISVGSLYQYFPTVDAILLVIYEETATRVAHKFRDKMLSVMHSSMETAGEKVIELLLKEYEANQLILHQMVLEVPHLTLIAGTASFDRLLRAGLRIYFSQFSQLSNKDVERVTFFLEIAIMGSLQKYLISKPLHLSKKEFLVTLNKLMVSFVRSQNLNSKEEGIDTTRH